MEVLIGSDTNSIQNISHYPCQLFRAETDDDHMSSDSKSITWITSMVISAWISPLVFIRMRRRGKTPHSERAAPVILKKFFDFGFVEARQLLFTLDDHGALKEVRIFEHERNRLV